MYECMTLYIVNKNECVQILEDKLFEFDEHIAMIALTKIFPKVLYIVPCKIEFMFMSPQNNRIRYNWVSWLFLSLIFFKKTEYVTWILKI